MALTPLDPEQLPESEWLRLSTWSAGYDAAFNGQRQSASPDGSVERAEYVAGLAQGMRDRKVAEADAAADG